MVTNREIVLIAIVAFLLGVIACQSFSPPVMTAAAQTAPIAAPAAATVAGQKFEQRCEYIHKYVQLKQEHEQSINDYLSLKAQSGWRLVSVSLVSDSAPYYCFVKEL